VIGSERTERAARSVTERDLEDSLEDVREMSGAAQQGGGAAHRGGSRAARASPPRAQRGGDRDEEQRGGLTPLLWGLLRGLLSGLFCDDFPPFVASLFAAAASISAGGLLLMLKLPPPALQEHIPATALPRLIGPLERLWTASPSPAAEATEEAEEAAAAVAPLARLALEDLDAPAREAAYLPREEEAVAVVEAAARSCERCCVPSGRPEAVGRGGEPGLVLRGPRAPLADSG